MRRFEFIVDRAHSKAVNEAIADVRRVGVTAVVVAAVLGLVSAWLIVRDRPWAYILAAVVILAAATALWVALWAPRRISNIEKLYAQGILVPTIVADVRKRGLTLLALIDVSKPRTAPQYALVARNVRHLPGHSVRQGERVPAVAVLGDKAGRASGDTWHVTTAMPLAWGTRDQDTIVAAVAAISDAEWGLLNSRAPLCARVRKAENQRLFLDHDDLPEELR